MPLTVIQVLFLLFFPCVILKSTEKYNKLSFISPVILCYLVGVILANLPFVPVNSSISMDISTFAVPLAIPLILFSTDFLSWRKLAKKTIISFILVLFSAFISTITASFLFRGTVPEHWLLSGMLIGVYTGGTPNMMSVGAGLNANEALLGALNVADTICGAIYFLFIISMGKWLLEKFLPPFKKDEPLELSSRWQQSMSGLNQPHSFGKIERFQHVLAGAGVTLLVAGIGFGVAMLITGGDFSRVEIPAILLITTLAIIASFIPAVRNIKGTYEAGEYLLLVFSLAIGSAANFSQLVGFAPTVFGYTAVVMFGAILLHYLFAAIFRIDADTTLITSTAGIYGPAFIGPIASVIKNKQVVLPGMLCGLIGYAIGNYLGFLVAWLLH